jgi:hypothetical protein
MDNLARLSRVNGNLIREGDTIAELIAEVDVAYAVWPADPDHPETTAFEAVTIKGRHLLGQNIDARITVIPVNSELEADLLRIHLDNGHHNVN